MEETEVGKEGGPVWKRVWHDPDDDLLDEDGVSNRRTKLEPRIGDLYHNRLVQNFEAVYGPTPAWARMDLLDKMKKGEDEEDDDDGDEETKYSRQLNQLSIGKLDIVRVEDLNTERKEGAIIRSVDFHPTSSVGLVAGNSCVSLYQVNGTSNPLIQDIDFDNFPIRKATFSASGDEIYVSSGLMSHFYCYDMTKGKVRKVHLNLPKGQQTIRSIIPSPNDKELMAVGHEGVYLLSKTSKEVIHEWTLSGQVRGATFNQDGTEVYMLIESGEVYRFGTRSGVHQCHEKFRNPADFDTTCLAVSPKYVACGTRSGYVSIFDNQPSETNAGTFERHPLGEIKNLVTPITSIKINSSQEIMAIASSDTENAIRLVHLPTRKTFAHFPSVNSKYGRCNSLAISPNSGYVALGSNRGCAYLFRLKHYSDY